MLPIVILAGGLATRLRPITETIPKSLVDVAGEPFVCRQLRYLKSQGISKVVMCTGYLGSMLEERVGTGKEFGLEVHYIADGAKLLGTGGAIKQAQAVYSAELGDSFFVLYGDSYLPIQMSRVQKIFQKSTDKNNKESQNLALMTVMKNQNQWDKSNVQFEDGRIVEYNKRSPNPKMSHIDYGLSILTPSSLDGYPLNEAFDLADLFHDLSVKGKLLGCEVQERFYEIGSHKGLEEATVYFVSIQKN